MAKCKTVFAPFMIAIDSREQIPYQFQDFHADAKDGGGPLVVPMRTATIKSGDYSLFVTPDADDTLPVAVERKSAQDFFHTLGQDRDRFERELVRLQELDFAKVVVECEWSAIFSSDGVFNSLGVISQLNPKTAWRSVLAWQQRYPKVHWDFVPGREFGEVTTLRTLERFWKEKHV